MDVTNMDYPESCFDIIIDKANLDCVLCGEKSFESATAMINVYFLIFYHCLLEYLFNLKKLWSLCLYFTWNTRY